MKYKCIICNKDIKLLKNHLRNSHKDVSFVEYFSKYPKEQIRYDEYNEFTKKERRENSPNCLDFYIKKGYSEDESKERLESHRINQPFRNKKDFRPNQIGYWVKKGFSESEAKEKVTLFQKRDLKSLQEVYGIENGMERYNNYIDSLSVRKDTEINNYISNGHSEDEAKKIYVDRRITTSPRRKEYWIKKGYSEEDAIKEVSSYQDNFSLEFIMKSYYCTRDDAIEIQDSFISKMLDTMEDRGLIIKREERSQYINYTVLVWRETNRNYRLYKDLIKTNGYERSKEFHLDHRFSIYEGFKQGINYKIIASPYNLELIPAIKNLTKNKNCSLNKEELLEKYNKSYEDKN